ncbi:MAG: N-acetylneuraminate synthase family protein [Candidatus Woesearchaeota archaeon]|nr:MAG: N-acetylneuraminate synthase family protein [Candidatus Woesearchaeota archaeon]
MVGEGHPCFIIAELGVNHNKDVKIAKEMIDAAIETGADAVKFQTWITEELMVPNIGTAEYHRDLTGFDSFFELAKSIELTYDDFRELKAYCDEKGIIFMSTPDEEKSTDFLDEIGAPAFKVSSPEFNNPRMVKHILSKGKPTLMSTGMNTLENIQETMEVVAKTGNKNVGLFHCVSEYPAPLEIINLNQMKTLAEKFGCVVGFSDHTAGTVAAPLAIAAGAKIYEGHFTLSRKMKGPDHASSLEPHEFKEVVDKIREAEMIMGKYDRGITKTERENSQVMKKVIVAADDIPQGTTLTEDTIRMMRADYGIVPRREPEVLGKTTKVAYKKFDVVKLEDLE